MPPSGKGSCILGLLNVRSPRFVRLLPLAGAGPPCRELSPTLYGAMEQKFDLSWLPETLTRAKRIASHELPQVCAPHRLLNLLDDLQSARINLSVAGKPF